VSIDGNKNIAESNGTSYSTPLAAGLLSSLIRELSVEGELAPVPLAKALMFHSAFLRNGPPDIARLRHVGLGSPMDLPDILHCRQDAARVIIQVPLTPKPEFHKSPFPMPPSLTGANSRLQGDVTMTLFYDSPLDPKSEFEYCRVNVVASLGTMGLRKRKRKVPADGFKGEVLPVPEGLLKAYPNEEEQVKWGFKWSPLKMYYRQFTSYPAGKPWELRLEMLSRAGFVLEAAVTVYLIVTVRAFKPGANVYNEMAARWPGSAGVLPTSGFALGSVAQ
jgi:hypothetical protein